VTFKVIYAILCKKISVLLISLLCYPKLSGFIIVVVIIATTTVTLQ